MEGISRIYSIIKRKNEKNQESEIKKIKLNPVKLERVKMDSDKQSLDSSSSDSSSENEVNGIFKNCMYSGVWKQIARKENESPINDEMSDESEYSDQLIGNYESGNESKPYKGNGNLKVKEVASNTVLEVYKEKDVIKNMYKQIEENWPLEHYPCTKTTLYKKTAKSLDLPLDTVRKVLKTSKRSLPRFLPTFNEFTETTIRKIIHRLYMNGKLPTKETVLQIINNDKELPNFNMATFNSLLNYLKLETVKKRNGYPLVDREDVMLERINYLNKIKRYRKEERCIYYLDEMILRAENSNADKKEKSTYVVIVHIGNECGFVKGGFGIFCTSTEPQRRHMLEAIQFEDWFVHTLPKLEKNSLVVMDDAPYHSRVLNTTPTVEWTKKDIQEWMSNKGIDYDENNLKFELLSKIKEYKNKTPMFFIDEIAKKNNVEILRIPPFHNELNPMNSIWSDIKTVVRKLKKRNVNIIKSVVSDAENKLPVERWRDAIDNVVDLEDNFYCKIDNAMDDAIDKYLDKVITDSDSEVSNDYR